MATEFIIGLQSPESCTLTPNSNLLELVLITERVDKLTIEGQNVDGGEILSAVLLNGNDIHLRVRDEPIEDTGIRSDLFHLNPTSSDIKEKKLINRKSLDLRTPFFDQIIMQQTCYSASDQPHLHWRRITYLRIDLGNNSIEIGNLRSPEESMPGRYWILPTEVAEGPCMISGIGMHNADLICFQIIAFHQKESTNLQRHVHEHLYAYGKSSVGLVTLKGDQLKSVEQKGFAGIEPSDPDVINVVNNLGEFMYNWYSTRSSVHRMCPDLYQIIDQAVTENDRSVIFAVFRTERHLRWRISNEVENGHFFDQDPFVRLKIFKVVECLSTTLEMRQRYNVNKPSINCFTVAYLSGRFEDVIIAVVVLITQLGLTCMLITTLLKIKLGQINFLPMNERLVITPILAMFSMMLIHKQATNTLAVFKAYPNMRNSLMGLFEIISNVILGILILVIQVVILAIADDNIEYVMNSIAAIFILELDDNVIFLNDDGITDLNRRLLMTDFIQRIRNIDNSYFKYKDYRAARNSHQIMHHQCELKPLPPIQFTSRSMSPADLPSMANLVPVHISFKDEQVYDFQSEKWAGIASSPTIILSKLTQKSTATLKFEWCDQGYGNRKGKLRVILIDNETGQDVASTPEYGIAPHEYIPVDICFGYDHGLVRNCEKGFKFVVEVVVGSGGGHQLKVKNFDFKCSAGFTQASSS